MTLKRNGSFWSFALFAMAISLAGCASSSRLTVMTYNIHHGAGMDGRIDMKRIADVIKAARPDLVAVQEVDKGTRRSGGLDESAELGRLTGMHAVFGKAMDYDGGEYGQTILSRFPIESMVVHRLPGMAGREPRIAVAAKVHQAAEPRELMFVGTHLEHQLEPDRIAQTKRLTEVLSDCAPDATILAGDFNAQPGSEPMKAILAHWRDTTGEHALTAPSTRPSHKIDWILVPKFSGWRARSARVIDEPMASDHRPVVVELEREK
jgi:endonuclease/exonuclease/phosphatase family metal-dependent hydrolase